MTDAPFVRDPSFGWDPWIGPGQPVGFQPFIGTRMFAGADTLAGDIGLLPAGLGCYASYVDNFGGWSELVARFGKSGAFLVSITIFGNPARCCDVEPGALNVGDIPGWLDHTAIHDAYLPWVYTSASNFQAANQAIGARKVIRWSAHYGFGPHICGPATCGYPQVDWTQWANSGPNGENYDRSVGAVLPAAQPTPPPIPETNMLASCTADHEETFRLDPKTGIVEHRWPIAGGKWCAYTGAGLGVAIKGPLTGLVGIAATVNAKGFPEIFVDGSGHSVHNWRLNATDWNGWEPLP